MPQERAYHAGGRYVFEMIRNLSQRHEIHLVTRLEENELPSMEKLRPFCKEIYPYTYRSVEKRGFTDNAALLLNYIGFSRFADRLARDNDYDLIHVEWVETALMMKKRKTSMALTAHDVLSKPAERRMQSGRGLGKLLHSLIFMVVRRLEIRTMKRFDIVFTLSEFDKDYLLTMAPHLRVRAGAYPAGLDITDSVYERVDKSILFLASYKHRRVNVVAALFFYREVFPLVRKRLPEAKFIIAGYGPPVELTCLQDNDRGVLVPGFVESIDECYKKASIFVAPILVGGGIIVKVLDAMAAATPVVTTSYGNEGIGAVPGRDLLVADDPASFAAAVIKLLEDPEFANKLALNGRLFVIQNFALERTIESIESAYQELAGKSK
jgi:glycosyltransferase involved in cell wall biosynthesis